jgi:preprotein translocase subunit SecE
LTYPYNSAIIKKRPKGLLKNFEFMRILKKLSSFLKEVRLEMKKVNWPSRKETMKYTLIIVGVSIVVAAFLGGLDYLFSTLLNRFIL